jgi:hypothetical protein
MPLQAVELKTRSTHDVVVAASRLARGDAALTLGVNMHLVYVLNVVRRWQIAVASGDERRIGAFAGALDKLAREGTVFAAAVSPLARAYRDVRATAFMHPLGANRAYPFLGELALGREPSLH